MTRTPCAAVALASVIALADGYFPESRVVDLVTNRPASLHVTLSTLGSVLDTIRVSASRIYSTDRNRFERRRRMTAVGSFFDQSDVARLGPGSIVQLLHRVPGISLTGDLFERAVLTRDMYTGVTVSRSSTSTACQSPSSPRARSTCG